MIWFRWLRVGRGIGAKAAEMEERKENEVWQLMLQGLMWWLRVGLEYNWQVWLPSLWCVCNLPGRCGGVWGWRAGSQIVVLLIFPTTLLAIFINSQFSYNLINFKTPDQPFLPILPKNVYTHFTNGSSLYTTQSILILCPTPKPCATHIPNLLKYI